MQNKIIKQFSLVAGLMILVSTGVFSQDNSSAIAAADTTYFSVNSSGGWIIYNSYSAAHNADSVELEIIIEHANTINFEEEHYIGRIKAQNLLPSNEQNIVFSLNEMQYGIRIKSTGECFLKRASAVPATQGALIVPVNIYYKK